MQDGIGNTVSLIEAFERTTRRFPRRTCFTFVEDDGAEVAYSYREVRMLAAALAWHLRHRGVQRGSAVAVDLSNGPMYVMLLLAAAYGGFFLVALNNRLTSGEKLTRVLELKRAAGITPAYSVDSDGVKALYDHVTTLLAGEAASRAAAGECSQEDRRPSAHPAPIPRSPAGRSPPRRPRAPRVRWGGRSPGATPVAARTRWTARTRSSS